MDDWRVNPEVHEGLDKVTLKDTALENGESSHTLTAEEEKKEAHDFEH